MAGMLKVIAFDAKDFTKRGEKAQRQFLRGIIDQGDYHLIDGYTNAANLAAQLGTLSQNNNHACIEYLEIYAHGNPTNVDSVNITNVATWGRALKTVNWCDTVSIYLSGCNTGLKDKNGAGPVAKSLADALPFNRGNFFHRITVFGTKGYLIFYGARANGSDSVKRQIVRRRWKWFDIDVVLHPPYPGSVDASGTAAWNGFKNGNW